MSLLSSAFIPVSLGCLAVLVDLLPGGILPVFCVLCSESWLRLPRSWGEPEFCVCVANGGSTLVIDDVSLL